MAETIAMIRPRCRVDRVPAPRGRHLATLVGLVLLVAAPDAVAGVSKRAQAKKQFAQAEKLYKVGNFEKAAQHYAKAYELAPLAPLLFNLGQCYKQLGNCERAIFYYETYLRESPDAPNAALANELLEECRRTEGGAAATVTAPAAEAPAAPPGTVTTGSSPGGTGEPTATDSTSTPAAPFVLPPGALGFGSSSTVTTATVREPTSIFGRWWFWTLVGGALAAAGTGTYFLLAHPDAEVVPPAGSLGTIDARTR